VRGYLELWAVYSHGFGSRDVGMAPGRRRRR